MTSRSATVLAIFVVAVFAFCLASVFAAMTGPISILPNETDSGGILDNLSAITNDTADSGDSYGYQTYDDYSSDDYSDDSSDVETTTDTDSNDQSDVETTTDTDSNDQSDVETTTDDSGHGSSSDSANSKVVTTSDD